VDSSPYDALPSQPASGSPFHASRPPPPPPGLDDEERPLDLASLLKEQLRLASKLQEKLGKMADAEGGIDNARDFQSLMAGTSNVLSLAHRTDELSQTLDTYKLFIDVTLEFIRRRSDQLGTDLLEELKGVAADLRAGSRLDPILRQ
jgi:hypothetical protein